MANNYFDSGSYTPIAPYTLGRETGVNNIASAVVAGFDKLPSEALLKEGKVTWGTFGGAANAHTVTLPYTVAYGVGLTVGYLPTLTNTGALTVNVNGLGAVAVKSHDGADLVAGDVPVSPFIVIHNGTNFRLVGVSLSLISASAAAAAASASAASSSASAASSSASAASSSASSAASSYDSFDDRYLGAKASDPTLDNDGNALLTGALYWNTVGGNFRVYNGSAWVVLGSGTLTGPLGSVDGNVAGFDGASGQIIKDVGIPFEVISDLPLMDLGII